jgi:DNA-binding response OmpR family regulator
MNERVLIVDDSVTVRMDLAHAFEAAGFRAIPCATLASARTALSTEGMELIVLDVVLPDGDGIDLLREIRGSEADTAIMVLSSEAEIKDRIRGPAFGWQSHRIFNSAAEGHSCGPSYR